MEALHQLAELFQQAVTKSDNTPNSVAPPNITQTRQERQAQIQTATPKHDTQPHCPNIIEDDNGNQPQKLSHENQPLGIVLPPQRNTSTPHHIPPDYGTSPRVTPCPRVEESPQYQMQSRTRRQNSISSKYADAENYIAIAEAKYVTHPINGQAQEYCHLIKGNKKEIWGKSFANELGRLAQGVGNRIDGTNTIFFEKNSAVPRGKKVTYGRLVCDIKEQKSENHRTRLTVGGNLLNLPGLLSTPTATVTAANFLFNSVIFTPGAKCLVADVKIST